MLHNELTPHITPDEFQEKTGIDFKELEALRDDFIEAGHGKRMKMTLEFNDKFSKQGISARHHVIQDECCLIFYIKTKNLTTKFTFPIPLPSNLININYLTNFNLTKVDSDNSSDSADDREQKTVLKNKSASKKTDAALFSKSTTSFWNKDLCLKIGIATVAVGAAVAISVAKLSN